MQILSRKKQTLLSLYRYFFLKKIIYISLINIRLFCKYDESPQVDCLTVSSILGIVCVEFFKDNTPDRLVGLMNSGFINLSLHDYNAM